MSGGRLPQEPAARAANKYGGTDVPGDVGLLSYIFQKRSEANQRIQEAQKTPDIAPAPVAPENDTAQIDAADEEARKKRMRAGRGVYDTLGTAGGYAGDTSKVTSASKTLLGT